MPKIKPPGGGHSSPRSHSAHHQSSHNPNPMDQVKIKRVKRNKKKATAKEKILAGLGVGGALMGGIGAVAPKPNKTTFVATQKQDEGKSAGSKIKSALKNIFGISQAKAFDEQGNAQEGDTRNSNGFEETFYQGNWILNNGQTKTDGGFNYGSEGGNWVLLDGQEKDENGVHSVSSGGSWVEAALDTQLPVEGDHSIGADGLDYIFTNQRWTLATPPVVKPTVEPIVETPVTDSQPPVVSGIVPPVDINRPTIEPVIEQPAVEPETLNPVINRPTIEPIVETPVTDAQSGVTTVTVANASTTTYNRSLDNQLLAIEDSLANNITNGKVEEINGDSVSAFALGWGGSHSAGETKIVGDLTYEFDGVTWYLQHTQTPPAVVPPVVAPPGTTPLTPTNANTTTYDPTTVSNEDMNRVHDDLVSQLSRANAPATINGNSVTSYMMGDRSNVVTFGSNSYSFDGVNWVLAPHTAMPTTPQVTATPAALTLQNINSIPFDGSEAMIDQLTSMQGQILGNLQNYTSVIPGSALAYMLGLGTGSGLSSGGVVTSSDGKTAYIYSTDASGNPVFKLGVPKGFVPLNVSSINSTQYDGSILTDTQIDQIRGNMTPAQIAALQGQGIQPGSVLAYMFGLGNASDGITTRTGTDGKTYKLVNGQWAVQTSDAPPVVPPANPLANLPSGNLTANVTLNNGIYTATVAGTNISITASSIAELNQKMQEYNSGSDANAQRVFAALTAASNSLNSQQQAALKASLVSGSGAAYDVANFTFPAYSESPGIHTQAEIDAMFVNGGAAPSKWIQDRGVDEEKYFAYRTLLQGDENYMLAYNSYTTSINAGKSATPPAKPAGFDARQAGNSTTGWIGSTTTPVKNGGVAKPAAPVTYAPGVTFSTNGYDYKAPKVGDIWQITVSGNPGQPVYAVANGVTTQMGTIGANGQLSLNGTFSLNDLTGGKATVWDETWKVGDAQVGKVNFTLNPVAVTGQTVAAQTGINATFAAKVLQNADGTFTVTLVGADGNPVSGVAPITAASQADLAQQIQKYNTSPATSATSANDQKIFGSFVSAFSAIQRQVAASTASAAGSASPITSVNPSVSGTLTFANNLYGSGLGIGNSWVVNVQGAAKNAPVYAYGGTVGGSQGWIYLGTTDASGNLNVPGPVLGTGDVGDWKVQILVGKTDDKVVATPIGTSQVGKDLTFTVGTSTVRTPGKFFTPTYIQDATVTSLIDGTVAHLNPGYYATIDTANQLAQRLGGTVVRIPVVYQGTFSTNYAFQYGILFPDGSVVNAGTLATYAFTNPGVLSKDVPANVMAILNYPQAYANWEGSKDYNLSHNIAPPAIPPGFERGTSGGVTASNANAAPIVAGVTGGGTASGGTGTGAGTGTGSIAPSILSTTLPDAKVGVVYGQRISASNLSSGAVWTVTGLPAGLTFNATTQIISGTPTAAGTSTISLRVVSGGQTITKVIALNVRAALTSPESIGDAPVIVSITTSTLPDATAGTTYSQALSASNLGATATWSASGLPAGLSINSSTGIISGTPTVATSSYGAAVTVTVVSASQTATKAFSLVVAPAANASAPAITGITPAEVIIGQSVNITIVGQNLTGATLTSNSASGLTISGVQVNSAGTQLTASITASAAAPIGLNTLTLTTANGSVTTSFSVNAAASSYSLSLAQTGLNMVVGQTGTVLATVTAPGGVLSRQLSASSSNTSVATVTADPNTGIVSIVATGVGSAAITVHPTGLGSDTSQDKIITVNVTAAAAGGGGGGGGAGGGEIVRPAFVTTNLPNAQVGQAYSGIIQASSNYSLTYVLTSGLLPPGLFLSSNGQITGSPTTPGSFTFTIQVIPSQGASETKQFTINVGGASGGGNYGGGGSVAGASTFRGLQMPDGYAASGSLTGPGSFNGQGLQMPTGLQMPGGYNDLSGKYANVSGTIYDKATSHGFSTPQEFFAASGASSFNGLVFDTNWRPGSAILGAATGSAYTVKKGDTLWSIAKKHYGDGKKWRLILEANTGKVKTPKSLRAGTVLVIPQLPGSKNKT